MSIYITLQHNSPRQLPTKVKSSGLLEYGFALTTLSEKTQMSFTMQPRIHPGFKRIYTNAGGATAALLPTLKTYNSFTFYNTDENTVTITGVITENGIPVVGRQILVVLMTAEGDAADKVYTDLVGNFTFYEVPQNLSLMAVAIDATFKYNAVILSKILTINTGEK